MTDATPATRARLPLHWKMAIGFGVGLIVGLIVHATGQGDAGWVQDVTKYVTKRGQDAFWEVLGPTATHPAGPLFNGRAPQG